MPDSAKPDSAKPDSAKPDPAKVGIVEIRVASVSQLFDTMDPYPFRERALADDLDAYIVGCAEELPKRQPVAIVIHLPESKHLREDAQGLPEAIAAHFAQRAQDKTRQLRNLLGDGRMALLTGLTVFLLCLLLARAAGEWLGGGFLSKYLTEGLVILGWVANWRPMEIFLYDWWPIVRERALYRRIAQAPVTLMSYPDIGEPSPII